MQLLQTFGIQPVLLTAQIVNFLIILYLLNRFAFKPILKMLGDRRKIIAESLKNAEETKKLLEKTAEKEKQVLQQAQAQAQEMMTEARQQASLLQQEAEVATRERVERMLLDAKKQIAEQTLLAEKQLTKQVAAISISLLEKSLKGFFSEKEQKEVIAKAVKKIRN